MSRVSAGCRAATATRNRAYKASRPFLILRSRDTKTTPFKRSTPDFSPGRGVPISMPAYNRRVRNYLRSIMVLCMLHYHRVHDQYYFISRPNLFPFPSFSQIFPINLRHYIPNVWFSTFRFLSIFNLSISIFPSN